MKLQFNNGINALSRVEFKTLYHQNVPLKMSCQTTRVQSILANAECIKGWLKNPYMYLALIGLMLILINQYTNIDLILADYYFDFQAHQFTWKNSWFAKEVMHIYVKNGIMLIGIFLIAFVFIDAFIKFKPITTWCRVRLRFVAVAAIVIPTIISGLKQMSVLHCPWDEQRYGGDTPYLRLFDVIPPNMEAGHCFPAGHASTGLWLAAFFVFCLPDHPRKALMVLFAGLGFGFVLGWVQQMRGAHFLSHTLWSIWIASAILVLMLSATKKVLVSKNNTFN